MRNDIGTVKGTTSNSVGMGRASGGAVSGYAAVKSGSAPGANNTRGTTPAGPVTKKMPAQKCDEAKMSRKPPNGGRM